jgi:hypothetical protein
MLGGIMREMQNDGRAPAAQGLRLSKLGGTALAVAGAMAVGKTASAALIGLAPNVSSGTWTYQVDLSAGSQVQNGDEFIIYDFGGYNAGSIAAPAGWTATAQLLTAPPVGVILANPDDPTLNNLVFVRSGGTVTNGGANEISLGNFSATTTFTSSGFDSFAYQDHSNANPNGPPGTGQASIAVPAVPEPAALTIAATGISLLTLRRRRD